jgi:CBS domain-containing protein/sporulation protein YlmC with PRC-barrel domain
MVSYSEPQVFLFLSQILGKKVVDLEGRPMGKVLDLLVNLETEPYPVVTHVLLKHKDEETPYLLTWQSFTEGESELVAHAVKKDDSREPVPKEGEILLKESLLDKQIVDTDGAKIRRVNDLQFLRAHSSLYLVHVDVGFRGLMRRVGLEKSTDVLLHGLLDYSLTDQFISWKFVQPLSSLDLLRLKITQNRLSQLHPADLADIIEDLDIHKRAAIFHSLDVETAAEILEETDPKIQVSLIKDMEISEASDIIEEMSLSEAADLLGDLPKDQAEDILMEMEKDIAEDVKELLTHSEETAGGLMTTSFLCFAPTITTGEALEQIRKEAEDMDFIYYLYVVDDEEHLLGMLSLRELLVAAPETPLADLMDTRVVSVCVDEDKDRIAEDFAKYGIMAIPVVDETNRIKGVIIFKNLLEAVAPQLR